MIVFRYPYTEFLSRRFDSWILVTDPRFSCAVVRCLSDFKPTQRAQQLVLAFRLQHSEHCVLACQVPNSVTETVVYYFYIFWKLYILAWVCLNKLQQNTQSIKDAVFSDNNYKSDDDDDDDNVVIMMLTIIVIIAIGAVTMAAIYKTC